MTRNHLSEGPADQGSWLSADLHVHTNCSVDVLPAPSLDPLYLYRRAFDLGLDFITFTDHDTMDAYDLIGWQRERVVPGVEISIRDRRKVGHTIHVNVYQLDRRQFRELREIAGRAADIELLLSFLEENRLPHTYNHPFGFCAGERASYRSVADLVGRFPVVEYNQQRVREKNDLAARLARLHGAGMVAVTDTHTGNIGGALTIAPGRDFSSWFENVRRGESRLVTGDLTLKVLRDEMAAWLEMFFNLDRLRPGPVCNSGTRVIPCFMRIFGSRFFRDYPRRKKVSGRVCAMVNRSGAPAACYLRGQKISARRIDRRLDLPVELESLEPVFRG